MGSICDNNEDEYGFNEDEKTATEEKLEAPTLTEIKSTFLFLKHRTTKSSLALTIGRFCKSRNIEELWIH